MRQLGELKTAKRPKIRVEHGYGDKRRPGFTQGLKNKILERDGYACQYCFSDATCVDHIVPWSYSYDNDEENLVACCDMCNLLFGNKIFKSFNHKKAYAIEWLDKHLPKAERLIWTKKEIGELRGRLKQHMIETCIIVDDDEMAKEVKKKLGQHRIRLMDVG